MGEFFLPPHVSFHETFFRGKDNFQLERKKNFFFRAQALSGENFFFFFFLKLKIVFAAEKCFVK